MDTWIAEQFEKLDNEIERNRKNMMGTNKKDQKLEKIRQMQQLQKEIEEVDAEMKTPTKVDIKFIEGKDDSIDIEFNTDLGDNNHVKDLIMRSLMDMSLTFEFDENDQILITKCNGVPLK